MHVDREAGGQAIVRREQASSTPSTTGCSTMRASGGALASSAYTRSVRKPSKSLRPNRRPRSHGASEVFISPASAGVIKARAIA
jgi:hypothetical protein